MATEWDVTEETPIDLTGLGESVAAQTYAPPSIRWDCSIGGLPFLFGMSDQYPMQRETADFRRQRIDNERDPGEQSLDSGYWIRSQSSWHYGSGLTSAEPLETNDTEARFRFQSSGGVSPWDAGKMTLLHDTQNVYASTSNAQSLLGVETGVLHCAGSTMKYIQSGGATNTVTWGGSSGDILSITSNGQKWIVSDDDGYYMGTIPSPSSTNPSGSGKIFETTIANNDRTLVRWVKSRVFAAENHIVWWFSLPSTVPGTAPKITTTTKVFEHPTTSWIWTDFAEGPEAIYMSGYTGDTSHIYKATVSDTGAVTSLTAGAVVTEMPRGEIILSMYAYLGSYLAIGTNKGLRIASINTGGSLSLGPLVHETTDGVYDMVAVGNYMWFTVGSKGRAGDGSNRAGLYRIDLGQNINDNALDFSHAADLVVPSSASTGEARQVTVANGSVWFAVTGTNGGVFKEQSTYVPTGYFTTGRIRLGTVEPKAWRDIRVISESTEIPKSTLSITFKALESNVAELTTSTSHYLRAGQTVEVSGVDSTFNGTYVVTFVSSSTKFRYAKIASNVGSFASPVAVTPGTPLPEVTFTPNVTVASHASTDGNGSYSSWPEVIYTTQSDFDRIGSLNQVTNDPNANLYVGFRLDTYNVNYTPALIGYQIRAIPAPNRSRLIRVPVLMYDYEVDRTGLRYGVKGGSWLRLAKMEALERSAATVSYFDYTTGERSEAYIEKVSYTRTTPPTRSQSGNGGIVNVTLRLL